MQILHILKGKKVFRYCNRIRYFLMQLLGFWIIIQKTTEICGADVYNFEWKLEVEYEGETHVLRRRGYFGCRES